MLNKSCFRLMAAAIVTIATVGLAESASARGFGFTPTMSHPSSSSHIGSSNSHIGAANCWNAGCRQPYLQYPSNGIGAANCWNAGCNQPYNQYHNVLN